MSRGMGLREARKQETSHRIMLCAQQLTEEQGLDGFTMDDLAAHAAVSRRTLFNYFPGKVDAILGPLPEFSTEEVECFTAGGPHGRLVEDLLALVAPQLTDDKLDRAAVDLGRRVLLSTPRLLLAAHGRFEEVCDELAGLVVAREGDDFGADQARLLLRILLAVFDATLSTFTAPDEDRPLAEIFDDHIRAAARLLA